MNNIEGKIIKQISDFYTVQTSGGIDVYKPRGNFRVKDVNLLVGDSVLVDDDKKIITKVLQRKNELNRPKISNIDIAAIITSVKEPNLDLNMLDKLLALVVYNNIEPLIIFTKVDLLENDKELKNIMKYYNDIYDYVITNNELAKFDEIVHNKEVVLTGQSGAGKTTFLNKLDKNLNLKTGEISKKLKKGKHTTRHTELFPYKNSLIADTPGFSNLDLTSMTKLEIAQSFPEFSNYSCKFRDCVHNKESGCKVKTAVEEGLILKSRYYNYLKFIEEAK